MKPPQVVKVRFMLVLSLIATVSFLSANQASAASIWRNFAEQLDSPRAEATTVANTALNVRDNASVNVEASVAAPLAVSRTAAPQTMLTSVSPTVLNVANRNAYSSHSGFSQRGMDAIDGRRGNNADTNRRHRRDPVILVVGAPSAAAAIGTPDSGQTVAMLGGALALLMALRTGLRKRASARS